MRLFGFVLIGCLCYATVGYAQSQPEPVGPLAEMEEVNMARTVNIFPNPATEFVFVEVEHFPADRVDLTVHTIIGNELNVDTEVISATTIRVYVKELAAGYYLLAVKDEGSNFRGTYKFLKR